MCECPCVKEAWMNQYRSKRGRGRLSCVPELIPILIAGRPYMAYKAEILSPKTHRPSPTPFKPQL